MMDKSKENLVDILNDFIDDDDESFSFIGNSPYFDKNEFISKFSMGEKQMVMISLNCQSLSAKYNEIYLLIDELRQKLAVEDKCFIGIIAVQETWQSDTACESVYTIPGYNFKSQPWSASAHGGLGFYIHESLTYEPVEIPDHSSLVWESYFLSISGFSGGKKAVIGNVYRPPFSTAATKELFANEFSSLLSHVKVHCNNVIIAGDFNLDLLKIKDVTYTRDFFENSCSAGFFPKITRPTRVTSFSKTLIDNFYCKYSPDFLEYSAGIFTNRISDHFAYFITLPLSRKKSRPKFVEFRKMSSDAKANFKCDLAHALQNFKIDILKSPDSNYDSLRKIISTLYEKNFPLIRQKFNKRKHALNPWTTPGIIRACNYKNDMDKKLSKLANTDPKYDKLDTELKLYKKTLRRVIESAKESYYNNIFEKLQFNMKKTWEIINTFISNKTKSIFPDHFNIDGKNISDTRTIASEFNQFFIDIGNKLSSTISESPAVFSDFLSTHQTSSSTNEFSFTPVSSDKVEQVINDLTTKPTKDIDGLSTDLLKYVKTELLPSLTDLVNNCLEFNQFPNELKIAKVIPIHKTGKNNVFTNYRPISILPVISKIVERIMHDQIFDYFTEHNLLYAHQYGFRSGHSTEHASLELVDKIVSHLYNRDKTIGIFMDLSKAFDLVDHKILLEKFKHYGFSFNATLLIENYLNDRKQLVHYNGSNSEMKNISRGVPQGSILGPLFFIIYINDLHRATSLFDSILFADDSNFVAPIKKFGETDAEISTNIQIELNVICDWLKANKLFVNISKTKFVIFHRPGSIKPDIRLNLENNPIECVSEVEFLGLTLNQHLDWGPHIHKIELKLSRTIGILSRLKSFFPPRILKTLYFSLFQSRINYQILTWGYDLNRIQVLQKKAIRIITKSHYLAHTDALFECTGILKVEDIFNLAILRFYFKICNNEVPYYFSNFCQLRGSDIHHYPTSSSSNLRITFRRKEWARKVVRITLPVQINNLPSLITNKALTHSYSAFISYFKKQTVLSYKTKTCTDKNCYSCNHYQQISKVSK